MKLYLNRKFYLTELAQMFKNKLSERMDRAFVLWYYRYPAFSWTIELRVDSIFSKVIESIFKEVEVRAEVYSRWVNLTHGMELDPDINIGTRKNENGILYFAEYIRCLHEQAELTTQDKLVFETIVNNLRYQDSGVFNRGLGESTPGHEYYQPPESRRTISQDNITAIACGSYLLGNYNECKAIALHGIKNFFVFNNIKPLRRLPLNPGNIASWLALGGYTSWALVFLPIYIINFIITMCKPASNTSSKKLYILELYSLQNTTGFKWLYKILVWRLKKQYGENYLNAIYTIYYLNPAHPLREITK